MKHIYAKNCSADPDVVTDYHQEPDSYVIRDNEFVDSILKPDQIRWWNGDYRWRHRNGRLIEMEPSTTIIQITYKEDDLLDERHETRRIKGPVTEKELKRLKVKLRALHIEILGAKSGL